MRRSLGGWRLRQPWVCGGQHGLGVVWVLISQGHNERVKGAMINKLRLATLQGRVLSEPARTAAAPRPTAGRCGGLAVRMQLCGCHTSYGGGSEAGAGGPVCSALVLLFHASITSRAPGLVRAVNAGCGEAK